MGIEERMRIVRLIERMESQPDYCITLGLVNLSRYRSGDRPQNEEEAETWTGNRH